MVSRTLLLLLCGLFFDAVLAGRFSEFAHRKGFGPNLRRRDLPERDTDSQKSKYRFLTDSTKREPLPEKLCIQLNVPNLNSIQSRCPS